MNSLPYWGVILAIVIVSISACKNSVADFWEKTEEAPVQVLVNMKKLRILDAPGLESNQMGILSMGNKADYAGEMTTETTKLKLGGVWYDEPWVSIITSEKDTGWIFGGGMTFIGEDSEEVSEILLEKKMTSFFGGLTPTIKTYRENYANANSSEEFAEVFHDGEELRDRMVEKLEEKIPVDEVEDLPNIFWIEDIMPGYVVELVAEGTQYYLFKDFKQLHTKATQTKGQEDDVFTDLGFTVYQRDSLEYFYPSWFMQTWDYGGHSLLGDGTHNDVLALADEVNSMSDFFKEDISVFKKEILRDITDPAITYWNGQERIVTELDSIISSEYSIINTDDIISLKARKKQFEDADANEIELNVRTGE